MIFLKGFKMCGIIGAVAKRNIKKILCSGLSRLEYRGYDSAGLAILNRNNKIEIIRTVGKVKNLIKKVKQKNYLDGKVGIAHTRWATHGSPSEKNAHPHISENIIVVHNGIFENYEYFKSYLINKGYKFLSETDTEAIAHLINLEQKKQKKNLFKTMVNIHSKLKGSYSMIIIDNNDPYKLIAIKYGSPLIIGCGKNENFIASDQIALSSIVKNFIYLEEGDIAEITYKKIIINNNGINVRRKKIKSYKKKYNIDKGNFKHYMEKEIYEQPIAIKKTLKNYLKFDKIDLFNKNDLIKRILSKVNNIKIVACGSSYHSGMVARYWFESLVNIHCDVEIASEFRYRKSVIQKDTLFISLSQSGETADTLAALRLAKNLNYIGFLAICNVENSSLVRESSFSLITKADNEIGVASTKAFTTQLTMLLMFIENIGRLKKINSYICNNIFNCLNLLPKRIKQVLSQAKKIQVLADILVNKNNIIFLGRGVQYPIAIEGALKLKEISYIHAEAYPAGELKHGPLALIDKNLSVIILAPSNSLLSKIRLNIEEVYARGGTIYLFTDKKAGFISKKRMYVITLPYIEDIIAPIFYCVPLQLLSYYIALIKCHDIDQPRNLAKSVTVE